MPYALKISGLHLHGLRVRTEPSGCDLHRRLHWRQSDPRRLCLDRPKGVTMGLIQSADAFRAGENLIGGKAFGLAKLEEARAPVPPWFVASADVFSAYLEENQFVSLIQSELDALSGLDLDSPSFLPKVQSTANAVQTAIRGGHLPSILESNIAHALQELGTGPYAVRSSMVGEDSAEHSFAGQLESFLFQRDAIEVCQSLKGCWASAYSDRALVYHLRAGLLLSNIRVAVVIQRMVDGDVSGVLFTANPLNGRRDEVLLTAAWGQGEGIVSGLCNTDEFVWRSTEAEVHSKVADKDIQVAPAPNGERGTIEIAVPPEKRNQRCLTPQQVDEICREAVRVAAHLGSPQDIEWTMETGTVYLVQSRPITSLPEPPNVDGPRVIWDNSNIQESFNGVIAPLTFSIAERLYADVYGQTMAAMNIPRVVRDAHRPMLENMLGLIRGRVLLQYQQLVRWIETLAIFWAQQRGYGKNDGSRRPCRYCRGRGAVFRGKLARLPSMLKLLIKMKLEFRRLPMTVEAFHRSFWDAYERVDRKGLKNLSFSKLMDKLKLIETDIAGNWHTPIINDFYVMMTNGTLGRFLTKKAKYTEPVSVQNALIAGEDGIESAMPTRILMGWARDARNIPELKELVHLPSAHESLEKIRQSFPEFGARLDSYIERYGDRMMGEQKLEETSLREDPSFLISVVRNYMALDTLDPEKMVADEKALRASAEREVEARLGVFGRWRRRLVAQARQAVKNRENMRMNRSRMFGLMREVTTALGHRLYEAKKLNHPHDVFYLTVSELESYHQGRSTNATSGPSPK